MTEKYGAHTYEINGLKSSQFTDEIDTFLKLVKAAGCRSALEIGVFEGGTSTLLYETMGPDSVVVGVDLKKPRIEAPWFKFVQGHSHSYHTASAVTRAVDGKPFDLIFIDAEHTESSTTTDYEMYRHYLASAGMLAFHDICMPELWPMWNRLRGARHCDRSVEIIRDVRQKVCGIGVLLGRL